MSITKRLRAGGRLTAGIVLSASILLIAACQPIVDPATLEQSATGTASAEALFEVEPAKATINTSALRAWQEPSEASDLVATVQEGETYDVLAMTSDGAWIELAMDEAPDGQGWVSTEFVTLEGDITNIATLPVDEPEAAAGEDEQEREPLIAVGEALIETTLPLRVRSAPTEDEDNKIGNVFDGETYPVIDVSEDGQWVLIDVPELSDVGGWIWAENAVLQGAVAEVLASTQEETIEEPGEADEATDEAAAETEAAPETEAAADAEPVGVRVTSPVQALIDTTLPLRVRSAPSDVEDNKIGNVFDGEIYQVLEISLDGQWVKINVPELSDDGGWIWAENAILEGDIVDALTETTEESAEAAEGEDVTAEETAETDDAAEAEAAGESEETGEASDDAQPAEELAAGATQALIETPLPLRVRSEPTEDEDNKIGNVFDGEAYPVLEISEDGLWVKIDVPELAEDGGWVSAEYVIFVE